MLPGKKHSRKRPVSKRTAAQKKKAPTRSVNHSPKGARFLLVLATFVVLLGSAGLLGFSAYYALPRDYQQFSFGQDSLSLAIEYPLYLAAGEEEELLITAMNTHPDTLRELREVTLHLPFLSTFPVAADLKDDSLTFRNLKWGETRKIILKVRPLFRALRTDILWEPTEGSVKIPLKISVERQPAVTVKTPLHLGLSPLPKIRSVMNATGALLLSIIIWLIQELWKIAFERD